MTKVLIGALSFLAGAAAGGGGVYLFLNKKYADQYEDDIEQMEEYYQAQDKYRRASFKDSEDDEVNPVKNKINPHADNGRDKGRLSREERDEIKRKLDKNWEGTTNYATMYDAGTGGEPDDDEEDPSLSDEEKQDYADAMDATEEHRKNKNRPPKIISAEAVGELPAYFNHETFLFYPDDQVLTDSDDNEIPDPETYIGDALTKYDFDMNDEKVIFVLNYATDTYFEIQKMRGSFYQEL